jgi:hypothetical protein
LLTETLRRLSLTSFLSRVAAGEAYFEADKAQSVPDAASGEIDQAQSVPDNAWSEENTAFLETYEASGETALARSMTDKT